MIGFLSWFAIVDFPDSPRTKFLDEKQKQFVLRRLQDDIGDENKERVDWTAIIQTAKDWKI